MAAEIVGIYVDGESLHHAVLVRRWTPLRLFLTSDRPRRQGVVPKGGPGALREFLQTLEPNRARRVCLALPRSLFFVRPVDLPPMDLEDVRPAVVNMLSVLCHLSPDEIYWDFHAVWAGRPTGWRGLLVYTLRKTLDPYLEALDDAGVERDSCRVFPLSQALAAVLSHGRDPVGWVRTEDRGVEVGLALRRGWWWSALCSREDENREVEAARVQAERRLGMPVEDWRRDVPEPPGEMAARMGLSAAPGMTVTEGGPCRFRDPLPVWIAALAAVLFLGAVLLNWRMERSLERERNVVGSLQASLSEKEARLGPYQRLEEEVAAMRALLSDLELFRAQRVPAYDLINRLAELLPEGVWIPSFQWRGDSLVVRCQGGQSLKLLDRLRESGLFEDVQLRGAVQRRGDREEVYTLSMKVKQDHGDSQ